MGVLSFPTFGYHVSTPHVTAYNPGGSTIDLRARVAMDDWTPTGNCFMLSKWGTATQYVLYIDNAGRINGAWTNPAGVGQFCNTAAATGNPDFTVKWLRALMDPTAGTCDFYMSDDGSTWTPHGAQITGKTTTGVIVPGTPPALRIGETDTGTAQWLGQVWRTQMYIGGVLISDIDFQQYALGLNNTTLVAQTGETWTIANSAIIIPGGDPAAALRRSAAWSSRSGGR